MSCLKRPSLLFSNNADVRQRILDVVELAVHANPLNVAAIDHGNNRDFVFGIVVIVEAKGRTGRI